MPIKTQNDLPAKEILENENIFVMDEFRAVHQDMRPLQVLILNNMPVKQDTELQLLRALSNTPLQIEVELLQTSTYQAKNTSEEHMLTFYKTFDDIKDQKFDGLIITGAPVEMMPFEEVEYWDELCEIMEWSKTNVTSTFHICWGALAGLYYHYGIQKTPTGKKLSGVYSHRLLDRCEPIVRSFDDVFYAPHSRYFGVKRDDVLANEHLMLLAESDEAGCYLIKDDQGNIYLLGHPEYDRMSLDAEYKRDLAKGMDAEVPVHYYENDDPSTTPLLTWRGHANTLYTNWLNFYVYQATPYKW